MAILRRMTRDDTRRVRVGYANTLFTRPLIRGLEGLGDRALVKEFSQEALTPALEAGEVDLALLPVHESLARPQWQVLPEICVGCFGEARLALLASRTLPTEIRRVRLDIGASPFLKLLELLLPRQVMIRPELLPSEVPLSPATYDFDRDPCEAFFLVGYNAFRLAPGAFTWTWDLIGAWKNYARTPFVALLWTLRGPMDLRGLEHDLVKLTVGNMSAMRSFCQEESRLSGVEAETLEALYTKVLYFSLDNPQIMGARRFAKELADAGLVPGHADFRFYRRGV